MSRALDELLASELARWDAQGLRRDVDAQPGASLPREREFTSNDYLSLANDRVVVAAARDALERFGAGGRAARLLGGGCALDRRVEELAAEWLGAEAALLFPSGYQANVGLVTALAGRGDALISDELVHASLIDAARLSRARVLVHRHVDLEHVERCLIDARGARRRFVLTEGVFSMDGDAPDLLALHELCMRHDAHLIVDEAHAVGLLGPRRAGAWEAIDPDGRIARDGRLAARLVTGGKALGVGAACVVGSARLRATLAQRARAFVFTTALSPGVVGALAAAIERARASSERAVQVLERAARLAHAHGLARPAAAIVPYVLGANDAALDASRNLLAQRFDVRAVRPPTVPTGTARLRIAVHAHNDDATLDELSSCLSALPHVALASRAIFEPHVEPRVLCVVGTDTDVGKTVVAAIVARAALRRGPASYWKPVQTGDASDTREVARLAGSTLELRTPLHEFALPASPHTAAAAEGVAIELESVIAAWSAARDATRGTLVTELAGGVAVPYDDVHTQADFLQRVRPTCVLVARSALGTLNHTFLTLEALRARGIDPRVLFVVGAPHAANLATLRARSGIEHVVELPLLSPLDAASIDAWLDHNALAELFA